jgi:hypothetical protein
VQGIAANRIDAGFRRDHAVGCIHLLNPEIHRDLDQRGLLQCLEFFRRQLPGLTPVPCLANYDFAARTFRQ